MSIEDGSDSKLWKRPEIPVCLKLLLHVKRAECYQNRVIVGLMSVSLMGPYPLHTKISRVLGFLIFLTKI